jgi:hypothetical protein
MKEIDTSMVCIHGDNHGKWDTLFKKIDAQQLKDCLLIGVGDTGVGFKPRHKQVREFELLNNGFKKRNIQYMSIRGNHCDPSYFIGEVKFSNFELLQDYSYRRINGEVFLFVGGAISIDRKFRVLGQSYWRNEAFVFRPELVEKCDVVVSHTPPYWLGPFDKQGLAGWTAKDVHLWDDCYKERTEMSDLIKMAMPKRSYHGHMHVAAWADCFECYGTILNIDEIVEHRPR